DYFGVSEAGQVRVDDDGRTYFGAVPEGRHRFLTMSPEQAIRAREAFVALVSEPPHREQTP
ncbi:MAG: nucleoside hydrolase, partial [Planctomycetales bacterium]|nr:nucleoside hydrolase [Planctomycetales bacterium]